MSNEQELKQKPDPSDIMCGHGLCDHYGKPCDSSCPSYNRACEYQYSRQSTSPAKASSETVERAEGLVFNIMSGVIVIDADRNVVCKTIQDVIAKVQELETKVAMLGHDKDNLYKQIELQQADNKALTEQVEEEKYIVKKFSEWYSDNGCPVTETKESYCPDPDGCRADYEKEQLKLDEGDRFPFDCTEDCETVSMCGVCYAEYYRMKFQEIKKGRVTR